MGIFDFLKQDPFDNNDKDRQEIRYDNQGECEEHEPNTKFKIGAQHPSGMTILVEIDTDEPVRLEKVRISTTESAAIEADNPKEAMLKAALQGKLPMSLVAELMEKDIIQRVKEGFIPPIEDLEAAVQPGGLLENNPVALTVIQILKEVPEWDRPEVIANFLQEIQKGSAPNDGCDCYACECRRMVAGKPTLRESGKERDIEIDLEKAQKEHRSAVDELENLLNQDDEEEEER